MKTTSHGHVNRGVPHYHANTEIKIPVPEGQSSVTVTLPEIARWFAFADPDVATHFLREVARQLRERPDVDPYRVYHGIGFHLRYCHCATDEAREMVQRWAFWAECAEDPHGGTNPGRRKLP